jgi:hypothetical protein
MQHILKLILLPIHNGNIAIWCCVKVIRFDIISTIACGKRREGSIRLNIGIFTIVAIYCAKQCVGLSVDSLPATITST